MQLVRNSEGEVKNKYALLYAVKLAEMRADPTQKERVAAIDAAISLLENSGLINWGEKGSPNEFIALMLKDRFTQKALRAYGFSAVKEGALTDNYELFDYGYEIYELSKRSGPDHPNCKLPD